MIPVFPRLLFVFLIAVAACSCGSKNETTSLRTEKDYRAFADTLAEKMAAGDGDFLTERFDMDALADKAITEANIRVTKRREFRSGFIQGCEKSFTEIGQMAAAGDYTLMRVERKATQYIVLFRTYLEGAINYHEYRLVEKNGKILIGDIYYYASGASLYDTMKDLIAASNRMDGSIDDPENSRAISGIKNIRLQLSEGNYAEACILFDALPVEIQNSKTGLLINVQASSGLSDNSRYENALAAFSKAYPNDAALPLQQIDYFFIKQEYGKSLAAINTLDKIVKDPALDYYRGSLQYAQGNTAEALRLFRKTGMEQGGRLGIDAWRSELNLLILDDKTEDALALCKELVEKKKYSKPGVRDTLLEGQVLFLLLPEVSQWFEDPS